MLPVQTLTTLGQFCSATPNINSRLTLQMLERLRAFCSSCPFLWSLPLCSQGKWPAWAQESGPPEEPIHTATHLCPAHQGLLPAAEPAASASQGECNLLPSQIRRVKGVVAAAPQGSTLPQGGGAGHSHSQTPTGAVRSIWGRVVSKVRSQGNNQRYHCITRA